MPSGWTPSTTRWTASRVLRRARFVLALGLDAHENDPFRGLRVTTPGFARAAARIRAAGLPTVIVQEGGYLSEDLTHNLASFLQGWIGTA